ncbi:hypothetical protein [Streptomyces sp. NBC_00078]|nr:hypothetical protein [Streptomyces sp. NBC_00078]MCX5418521.1 hypothetical protein [Streptomyces sp. NBC_00078]
MNTDPSHLLPRRNLIALAATTGAALAALRRRPATPTPNSKPPTCSSAGT